ncbi:amidohydrolase family protein [Lipingzhangella sp. LS1_29]|uniref:Amidohydrolase family protein n=1 Tax=Lipingzhangella rawalii TaxID=2055835 RepID=A0ABU2H1V5_9ACTN|nr:amidohydrolase family protein [Lipingzhangella rawalii]MDS1268805.1 amidohydrolase family protein [Lipingzhangella rawalii]
MSQQPLRFTGARLIDGTGTTPVDNAVVVTDASGQIAYAGTADSAPPHQPEQHTVDVDGRVLLPGFIDCHVHLGLASPRALLWNHLDQHRSLLAFETAERMRATLEAGVTTVRDLGGLDAGFRTAWQRGLVTGPRMQLALRLMSHTGGHADFTQPSGFDPHTWLAGATEIADSEQEAVVATRRLIRDGADVIKVCATGGLSSPSDTPHDEGITAAEITAIVDEARRHGGRAVAAHAQGAAGIRNAVEGGVTSVEHGYLIDDAGIELMLERGTFLVPTLNTFDYAGREHLMTDKAYAEKLRLGEVTFTRVAEAIRRGVRVALGTDAGIAQHGANLGELRFLTQLGMSPQQAIAAGTRDAAQLLGLADRIGTVEAGKLADLVVCDGDPLHDVEVLTDPTNIRMVVQAGQTVKDTTGTGPA